MAENGKLKLDVANFHMSVDCGNSPLEAQFQEHMSLHGLHFETKDEYKFRFGLFQEKDSAIKAHNEKETSFKLSHNKFSTWTKEEYKAILGYRQSKENTTKKLFKSSTVADASVDWRAKNMVLPVKD